MKVKELIQELKKINPDLDVVTCEDHMCNQNIPWSRKPHGIIQGIQPGFYSGYNSPQHGLFLAAEILTENINAVRIL